MNSRYHRWVPLFQQTNIKNEKSEATSGHCDLHEAFPSDLCRNNEL